MSQWSQSSAYAGNPPNATSATAASPKYADHVVERLSSGFAIVLIAVLLAPFSGLWHSSLIFTAGDAFFLIVCLYRFRNVPVLTLGVDGLLNQSLIPFRIATLTSLIIGTLTLLFIFDHFIGKVVFGQDWPRGFATTTVLVLLSITLNALFLGIVGEYLGRIFMHIKKQFDLLVESELNKPRWHCFLHPSHRSISTDLTTDGYQDRICTGRSYLELLRRPLVGVSLT